MFYSHEILQSRQYGVATIWLVATIGNKSGPKRVSKKAIQDVDLERAIEKIIEPGAPIALRLQGSLLYGVSRVYQQKCQYMLTDLQKIQGHMMTFLRSFGANQVNPEDVKARPENLMIMDDPNFVPDGNILPDPTADMFVLSQFTNRNSSQMSPYSLPSGASYSGNEQFPVQLELRDSSVFDSRTSTRGLRGLSSAPKLGEMGDKENIFGEELEGPMDFGIQIDEFGNIIENADSQPAILDESDLPPMPTVEGSEVVPANLQSQIDEQGDFFRMNEQPLPDAEPLPARVGEKLHVPTVSKGQSQHPIPAPNQRRRKVIHADLEIEISRNIMREWQTDYLENCTMPKTHAISHAQARRNAIHLTFGLGIGNIGQILGITGMNHPLTVEFSGDSLYTAYTGLEALETKSRKRVRSATESVEGTEEKRRVRPRLGADEKQREHEIEMDDMLGNDQDQSPPEQGREAQSALDDHPSSAMPWNNRGSSLMPGSSMQKGGSVQFGREQSSPLGDRGGIQDIARYSSDVEIGGMHSEAGGLHSADSSYDGVIPLAILTENTPAMGSNTQTENQYAREALDHEGKNFLLFIEQMIREHGERRHDEDFERQRKWIDLDDVFVPSNTNRITAAQAFYHVLTLVTKGQMLVEQDNEGKVPFGGIHVGIKVPPGA